MNLLETIQYIVGLNRRDETILVDGATFVTGKLKAPPEYLATPLHVSTLQSVADFLIENRDGLELDKHVVHVEGPTRVVVVGPLSERRRQREKVLVAEPVLPEIKLNTYLGRDLFQVQLQSCFEASEGRAELLRLVGNMEAGEVRTVTDDGMSQEVVVRKHTGSVERALAPKSVELRPYRTFSVVEQPAVEFVFRVRDSEGGGIQCALFEADGGRWRVEAADSVAEHLQELLADVDAAGTPAILR